MAKKIITVFKTHFDIGFTELAQELLKRYSGKMLQDILHTCQNTSDYGDKKYVWTFASWVFLQTLKNATEEDRNAAIELLKNGQLAIHGLPFTLHTEFLGLEELNRVCNFAKSANEEYGVKMPISAKMTDVPGHTFILPTILSNAGIKFMHIGVNAASKPVDLPLFFWWEGPDGSRVLTFYNKGGYGSSLMPPKDWKYPVWLALMQSNDNIGPQSPEIIEQLEKEIHRIDETAVMQVGTMDDFYREIIKCDLSDLPVVKADFADSWIHGVGSYPLQVSKLRRNRTLLCALQTIAALIGEKDLSQHVDEIYENAILFGEHTWGLDVKTTLGYARSYDKYNFTKERETFPAYKRMEESWEEQISRADKAIEITEKLRSHIEKSVVIKDKRYVTVFNPEATEKTAFVELEGYISENCGLTDKGKPVRIINSAGKLYAEVKLGAVETKSFAVTDERKGSDYKLIDEKNALTVKGDEITVSVDKKTGALIKLVENSGEENYIKGNTYEYEVISAEQITQYIRNYTYRFFDWAVNDFGRLSYPFDFQGARFVPELVSVRFDGDAVVCEYKNVDESVKEYGNSDTVRVVYTVLGKSVNVRLTLNNKQASPFVEGGNFIFDFNLENPEYTINKVGSLVNPEKDVAINANNKMYCMENFIDITDGKKSIALISRDAPLFSIGESGVYKFSGVYEKRNDAKIYVNLFNNQWGTNFPQWIEGTLNYEFDLVPHSGGVETVSDVIYSIIEKPLVFKGRILNVTKGDLIVEGGKLMVAFVTDKGVVVRIREDKNRKGKIRLAGRLTKGKVHRANSFGEPQELCGNEFASEPLQIHTLLLGE